MAPDEERPRDPMTPVTRHRAAIRTEVLGVPVDAVDTAHTLELVHEMLSSNATHVILAVNPEKVIASQEDPDLFQALHDASLVIPDGIGVVLAARLLGKGRMQRVAGSDLMPEICRIAASQGERVFLFGAKPGVAEQSASILKERWPSLEIAGCQHGYIGEPDMPTVIERINASGAGVLFVGLGSPRQELWMRTHRDQLAVKICQGVGGTFDAICGNPPRAPLFFRKVHLEWLFRLATQPRRLARQTALPKFAFQVMRQMIRRS